MAIKFSIVFALVLLALVHIGTSLKCYSCTGCEDNGAEKTCVSNTPGENEVWSCYLITGDNGTTWDRGCIEGVSASISLCKYVPKEYCGICKDDLCNDVLP